MCNTFNSLSPQTTNSRELDFILMSIGFNSYIIVFFGPTKMGKAVVHPFTLPLCFTCNALIPDGGLNSLAKMSTLPELLVYTFLHNWGWLHYKPVVDITEHVMLRLWDHVTVKEQRSAVRLLFEEDRPTNLVYKLRFASVIQSEVHWWLFWQSQQMNLALYHTCRPKLVGEVCRLSIPQLSSLFLSNPVISHSRLEFFLSI